MRSTRPRATCSTRRGWTGDRDGDQSLPVPEPAFGCVIEAGISTVGQMIRCHGRHRMIEQRRGRTEIVKCLGINAPGMTIKAALRTLGCWLTFGYL